MNPASQHLEGKLLDYAYGELSESEAKTVETHLRACPQCADSLTQMKQVRRAMSQLPMAPAPQAGLESLMAYAQKAAETARARPARRRRWLLWVVPIGSAAALSLVLTVSTKVMRRPEATVAFKQDDTRGDWEGLPGLSEKKEAGARVQQKPLAKAKAPATEAEPQSQWARAPKDRKGAPAVLEPAALPPAQRRAAAPKPEAARPTAAPAGDDEVRHEAREDIIAEEQLPGEGDSKAAAGGVVGGILGGVPSAGDSEARKPSEVASQHAAGSVEVEQALNGSRGRSSTPSSPAAERPVDREREVAQLRQALAAAQGQERARLLRRLCDALDALGRTRDADAACDTVVREFPTSKEAKSALERLKVRAAKP